MWGCVNSVPARFDLDAVDLADPDLYAFGDPEAVWRTLRAHAPVHWSAGRDGTGFWSLTRHADVVAVYGDPATFSSARGNVLNTYTGADDPGAGKMLSMTDGARHRELRGVLNRYFTPAAVAGISGPLERSVRRLVRRAIAAGSCDFTNEVAAPVPLAATCALMGIPASDWDHVLELTRSAFSPDELAYDREHRFAGRSSAAHIELLLYCTELLARRRSEPGDDLITALAHAEVGGRRLSDEEIILTCDNLIVGGNETARFAAAAGALALAECPGAWDLLKRDRTLVGAAVEEILRFTSPGMHVLRTATRRVELHGTTIEPGDAVVLWNASANRDEAAFEGADELRVARRPNRHVALGLGTHFCIGAALARVELGLIIEALLDEVAAIEVAGTPERLRSQRVRGHKRLPLRLHPEPGRTVGIDGAP